MKINKKVKVITAMLIICCACVTTMGVKVFASEEYAVNKNMNSLMEEIDVMIKESNPELASSNPYDYINNDYYNNIVARGIPALPVIVDEINSSDKNGLREYILAIAAEEIAHKHLNEEDVYRWSNAKEWLEEWNIYLRNIPVSVDYIINDTENTMDSKKAALTELGVMSLPYIKDAIDEGNTDFIDVYYSISNENMQMDSVNQISGEKSINISDKDIDIIREMVEAVRVDFD